ncbi:2412_t:CDS:2, partial [Entrophospora sp. SA101]
IVFPVFLVMSSIEPSKMKKKILTWGEKKELCEFHEKNPSFTYKELGNKFGGIAESTVCNIVKDKEKCEAGSAPPEEIIAQERNKLQELISEFPLEDVYNCDEIGEFIYKIQFISNLDIKLTNILIY